MKLKKNLLTIVLALFVVMILQVNVNAGNVSEYLTSEYDCFLTESNKVLTKADLSNTENSEETIIAAIKGSYTGTIVADNSAKTVTINNFIADKLIIFDSTLQLFIEGENIVKGIEFQGIYGTEANGNGKITTTSYIKSTFLGHGEMVDIEDDERRYHLGNSIDTTCFQVEIKLTQKHIDSSGKILNDVVEKICKIIENAQSYADIYIHAPKETVIPSSIFAKLKESDKQLGIYDETGVGFYFRNSNIINANSDFKISIEESDIPIDNMLDTKVEDAKYIKFKNTGSFPGKATVFLTDAPEFPNSVEIYVYYFNENKNLYELKGIESDQCYIAEIDYLVGKYVITHTKLPKEFVSENDNNEENGQLGGDKQPNIEQKEETKKDEINKDETKAPGNLPYTGGTAAIVISIVMLMGIGIVSYIKNKDLKGI